MEKSQTRLWLLILFATIVRLIITWSTGLGNDEVYYWTYAQDLQWNYFDHPPFVAWLIRLTTGNLWIHHETAVRFGAILSSAVCTWLIYQTGLLLGTKRTGWYAALLYTSSFYCSVIAGTFILPDSPQMVFWFSSILLLLKINKATDHHLPTFRLWCWFGLTAGLCILCKVHGIFLWGAVLICMIFINRKFSRQPGLYISGIISLLLTSPIIIWNFQHDFITYTYHSARVSPLHASLNLLAFLREITGELLYNNPIIFFLVWISISGAIRGRYYTGKKETQILLACSLPLISVLVLLSLFKDTLPHWSGPAYACLIILVALKLSASSENMPKSIKASMGLFAFIIVAGLLVVNYYPGTLSPHNEQMHCGEGDPTLDLYGWKETGRLVNAVYKSDVLTGTMPGLAPIIITRWFPAAHLDFYVGSRTGQQTYGMGKIFDLHQYYWYNMLRKKLIKGDDAYYIIPSSLYNEDDAAHVQSDFETSGPPVIMPVYRNGIICKNIILFRLKGYKDAVPEEQK